MDPDATIKYTGFEGAPPDVRAAAAEPGRWFGRYVMIALVARGGFGEVWKAWESGLGRTVALKFLMAAEREDRERFIREAQMAGRLAHPSIVPVYDLGTIDGKSFIAMAFVEGTPLSERRLPAKEALTAIRDAARAVHYAHEQGIIHRDLKPANIMLDGRTGRATVLDFGLARQVSGGSRLTLSGAVAGTPAYMSPEQARGRTGLDARTDVYGLGATLYDLVTGLPPFEAENVLEMLRKIDDVEPVPPRRFNPRLDADVETIIHKAMEKEADRRYASAAEFADDIDRALAGEPIHARRAGISYRIRKHVRRHPGAWAMGALTAAAIVAGVCFGAFQIARRTRDERCARTIDRAGATVTLAERQLRDPTMPLSAIQSRLDDTIRSLTELRAEFPGDARIAFWIGRAWDLLGNTSGAVAFYGESLALDPSNGRARLYRARAQTIDALRTLRTVEQADAVQAALAQLAEAGAHLKNAQLAEASPRERMLVTCYRWMIERDYPSLVPYCEEQIRLGGDTEEFSYLLGWVAASERRADDAVARFDEAIRGHPRFAAALFDRGVTHWFAKRYAEAEADFSRVIELRPGMAVAYMNRGTTRTSLKKFDGARADLDRAIALDGTSPDAFYDRALVRSAQGDAGGALTDLDRALAIAPRVWPMRAQAEAMRDGLRKRGGD